MMQRRITLGAAIVFCFVFSLPGSAFGQNLSAQDSSAINQRVAKWIEKLDSRKFSERVEATRQLQRLGVAGVEGLAEVVLRGNSDASNRALEILKNHLQSDSSELSAAARKSLQMIADQSDHRQAAAAKRILTPPSEPSQLPNRWQPNALPPRAVPPPIFKQQRVSVSIKNINGKREISVDENGRKFRFKDDGDGLKVTRPDDKGGERTKQYKDEDALKKADAEAYKIYRRYASNKGGHIQIQMNGLGINGGLAPGVVPPGAFPPRINRRPRRQRPAEDQTPSPNQQKPQPVPQPAPKQALPETELIEV